MQFGHQILAVGSNDLVSLDKTVRICPRGVQRVSCHVRDLARVGHEVLIEGVVTLGDQLYSIPSLEIVHEDENQGTNYREIKKGLKVAESLIFQPMFWQKVAWSSTSTSLQRGVEFSPACKYSTYRPRGEYARYRNQVQN